MAKYTVLLRFHYGRGWTQLPEKEKKQFRKGADEKRSPMHELLRKWKAEGIELKGSMTCSSHPEGYAHHLLFGVDSFEQMRQMDMDVFLGEMGKIVEKFDLHIGSPRAEEMWAEV
jgi:hypothetical protein